MKLQFSDSAWEDYLHWQSHDPKLLARINTLLKEIQRQPFAGIGKPEPLKHALQGYWSRRTGVEHRIVYAVAGEVLLIAQLRNHY